MSTTYDPRSRGLLALALILAVFASLPLQAAWQGKTVEKDGVTQIMNPAKSMAKPETIELEELWRVGGDDDGLSFKCSRWA